MIDWLFYNIGYFNIFYLTKKLFCWITTIIVAFLKHLKMAVLFLKRFFWVVTLYMRFIEVGKSESTSPYKAGPWKVLWQNPLEALSFLTQKEHNTISGRRFLWVHRQIGSVKPYGEFWLEQGKREARYSGFNYKFLRILLPKFDVMNFQLSNVSHEG